MLVILSGLPATGKTTIARELVHQIGAVHVRVDSIEHVLRETGIGPGLNDTGYRVAYAVAADNLRLGRTVIADSVNPLSVTRDAWVEVAKQAGTRWIEVEIACSNAVEHLCRVESRINDLPGFHLPTWQEVVGREYDPWQREHLTIETSVGTVAEYVQRICEAIRQVST